MRPQEVDSPSSSSRISSKRKIHDIQDAAYNSNSSTSSSSRVDNHKKLKTSSSPSGNFGPLSNMSKAMGASRTQAIDLRPSNFQPHTGAKRLVIKNLRVTPRNDAEQYYEKTWKELDDALTSVFDDKSPMAPLEVLCRGVEATCRHGRASKLYEHLERRCQAHVKDDLSEQITDSLTSHSSPVEALQSVERVWEKWQTQLKLIRSIFSYLDRSYLLNSKHLPQLEELGIQKFRGIIFGKRGEDISTLARLSIRGINDLVEFDRESLPTTEPQLLRTAITMLRVLGIYTTMFEEAFQHTSLLYFERFASERGSSSLSDYILSCDTLLQRENLRCDTYGFDSVTRKELNKTAHRVLISKRSNILLEQTAVSKLLGAKAMTSLKSLYELLCLAKIQEELLTPFAAYIKTVGTDIAVDKERGDEMVVRLLELKRSLDVIIRDAFRKDQKFKNCLRDTFAKFINDPQIAQAWGSSTSKVGEMIAKYVDLLLRGGVKAVPASLASDVTDRNEAEKLGQASTGDPDAELDRQLDQGLELFRFIQGKDVFEAFYKKDLARRILMGRSASQDAERNMLAKLRSECGNTFTHNLEQMFKDQDLARDEMISYKQSLSNTSKTTMDLQVNVLSAAAWPTYPDITVNLPSEVARHIEKYDRHYKHKHTGRRLTWKHSLAHSIVKATFNKGPKELLVSAFQAIVLVLFNEIEPTGHLTYTDISTATGLPDAELERTLQSLACAKSRVLTKHPKGREINHTDTFTVNLGFTDSRYRIKINQIQLKETKEENKETHERISQDRQYETQAAIVRIMKSRKKMTHQGLVAEVINQTKGRGAVEPVEIKKCIGKLIEKDYLEREDEFYTYMA